MGKWLERAAQMAAAKGEDNRDDRDSTGAIGPIVPNVPGPVSPALLQGLQRLRTMAAPRLRDPSVWPEITADALRLMSEGWAAQALTLGWHPLNLWGVSPAVGGIADLEGLAVKLAGRRIALLDATSCIITAGSSRSVFHRRSPEGAVFLWELGRRGHGR